MADERNTYVVVKVTFPDGELEGVYEELVPNGGHSALNQRIKDGDSVQRNFFEMGEKFVASVKFPAAANIAADVSYLAIETSITPGAASPDWQQANNTQDEDIQIASAATYESKTKVLDADIAALGPCRLAFYDALDVQVSPADGDDSVWYIIMKGVN